MTPWAVAAGLLLSFGSHAGHPATGVGSEATLDVYPRWTRAGGDWLHPSSSLGVFAQAEYLDHSARVAGGVQAAAVVFGLVGVGGELGLADETATGRVALHLGAFASTGLVSVGARATIGDGTDVVFVLAFKAPYVHGLR